MLVVLVCASALPGCGGMGQPRHRIGSLPFPGPYTIYSEADAGHLGWHRYQHAFGSALAPEAEVSRGTIYTCRAGFLDVAHLRLAIDWTRYAHDEFAEAMREGKARASFRGPDGYRVSADIVYPPVWRDMPADARERAIEDGSILGAQRASYLIWTWHEAITWQGYSTFAIISEEGSAFGYDDVASHAVGVAVGGEVLRDPREYNEAVTDQLNAELERLGVVDRACFREALHAVEGEWWTKAGPLKRELDAGLETGRVPVRLVPGLGCCPDGGGADLPVPFGTGTADPVLAPRAEVRIEPRTTAGRKLASRMGITDKRLDADDIARILDKLRGEVGDAW